MYWLRFHNMPGFHLSLFLVYFEFFLNPFSTNVSFLYPLKTSENRRFLMFSGGVEVEN